MQVVKITLGFTLVLLAGCLGNPINKVTSDNYTKTCSVAEKRGDLEVAEEACYRALVNTNWGNLGEELKSEKLYNLALIKRRLGKFSEAESLLKESLRIEESISSVINIKTGRRLVELSVNLAAQNKWEEGSVLLEKVMPISSQYSGREKDFIILVLNKYGQQFNKMGDTEKADMYISKANEIQIK